MKMRAIIVAAYLIIVFILTRLCCTIDAKLRDGVIITDINSGSLITETDEPE